MSRQNMVSVCSGRIPQALKHLRRAGAFLDYPDGLESCSPMPKLMFCCQNVDFGAQLPARFPPR